MNGTDLKMGETSHTAPRTLAQARAEGAEFLFRSGVDSARLDAELLLCRSLGVQKEYLYVNDESTLGAGPFLTYASLLKRRAQREPMAYILGQREFWSLDFNVSRDVLVPRPETEILVEETLCRLAGLERDLTRTPANPKFRVLDLGTGCGAIAVSLAKERDDLKIWATDVSSPALEIARSNARRHGVEEQINFLRGDLFEPFAGQSGLFHAIVSNPPYVNQREMDDLPRDVRWEPKLALDGGQDGLDFYRWIVPQAPHYLAERGFLAMETGMTMGQKLASLINATGNFSGPSIRLDCAGRERVISAQSKHCVRETS